MSERFNYSDQDFPTVQEDNDTQSTEQVRDLSTVVLKTLEHHLQQNGNNYVDLQDLVRRVNLSPELKRTIFEYLLDSGIAWGQIREALPYQIEFEDYIF